MTAVITPGHTRGCTTWGTTVVVVTHVSPVKAAVVWATGAADGITWRMHLDLASITRGKVWPDGTPYLSGYNDVSHLAG